MIGNLIILFLISALSTFLFFKFKRLRKYGDLLFEQEALLDAKKTKLNELRNAQKKERSLILTESSILQEHIVALRKEVHNDQQSKKFLLDSTRFLLIHAIEVNNYLVLKNSAIQDQLKVIDPDLLTDADRQFVKSIVGEIIFTDNTIQALNTYYYSIVGEHFIKKLNDPEIVKGLIMNQVKQNRN